MSAHLLLITLGPVQDFIAQARRTRDLWYGSHLLSELGRAAARALVDSGAQLIFPALEAGDPELRPCPAPTRPDGAPPLNVANKLLAQVPPGSDPAELARRVREAVARFWKEDLAAPVRQTCAPLLAGATERVWEEQVDSFLEFAATWAPLQDYAQTRRSLEGAIAGRKLLRDFDPWRHARGNVPKSSLDGARETVLAPPRQRAKDLALRLRIADGEQLDAVGLIKRAGGKPDQFLPVVNVAMSAWLAHAAKAAPAQLAALQAACAEADISRVNRPDLAGARAFPFDASVLLPDRWATLFGESDSKRSPEDWGRTHVRPLLGRMSEPYPYVACLLADGDHMGRAMDSLTSPEEHRALSQALAKFATDARKVVEQEHLGALVYAGGDDVLAFVPLPNALACAAALREAFAQAMVQGCPRLAPSERPTLSVGLGVGHVMESLGQLLQLARQAERNAKRERNALAVILDKRSGGTRAWQASWNDAPVSALQHATDLLQERLPSRKAYEIATILTRLPAPADAHGAPGAQGQGWSRVLALEVSRSLGRIEGGGLSPSEAGLHLDPDMQYADLHAHVSAWVERVLIARTFARATVRERQAKENVA